MYFIKILFKNVEEILCCMALALISICVFAQVMARYVFEIALHWTEEVAAICMVWAVYTGASLCVKQRYHIRILIAVRSLPSSLGRPVIYIADFFWAAFSIFMIKTSYEYLAVLWKFPSFSPSLGINQFYPQTILIIGYALMLIRLIETYTIWYREGAIGLPGLLAEDLSEDKIDSAEAPK